MRGARRVAAGPRATLGANLGLMHLNLGPPDRSLAPRDVQEASRVDFGAISDPSGRPWKPKNTVKYDVFAAFHVAPQRTSRSSKSALGGSQNDPQEAPRSGPARPRRPPRRLQERHKRPKSAPRAAQTRLPSGLGGQVGPNWHKRAARRPSKGHFGPLAGRFCTLRGSIFVQFSSLGKHSQSCPVGKACASLRPAPLYLLV